MSKRGDLLVINTPVRGMSIVMSVGTITFLVEVNCSEWETYLVGDKLINVHSSFLAMNAIE